MIRFRSPAECRLQKVVERDVGLERVGLAFDRQNLRLLDVKLGGIFADYDAILFRNEVSQNPQECGLPVRVPPLMSNVFPLRIC
jgi:hypothetical protein